MNMMPSDYFEIKKSDLTFESILNEGTLSQERATELKRFKMLILPVKKYYNEKGYFFYSASRDFYWFCKKENPDDCLDFCVEKSNFKELSLNCNEIYLGTFIILQVALPIFCNLISNFIYDKLNEKDDKIAINIIINNNITQQSHEISFKGTKTEFDEKVIKTLHTYSKNGAIILHEQKGTKIDVLS